MTIPAPILKNIRIILFLIAFIPRALLPFTGVINGITADSTTFLPVAESLVQGHGFADENGVPTAVRPPTYPLFLAGMMALGGGSIKVVQVIQALLTALIAPVLFELCLPLVGRTRAAIAGFLYAVDAVSLPSSTYVLTEAIGAVLLVLWFSSWIRIQRTERTGAFAWSGLLAGALAYQTMISILLQPAACALRLITKPGVWKKVVIAGFIFLLPLAAWSARNKAVLGEGTAIRSGGFGVLLWMTVHYDFPWLLSPFDERGEHLFKHRDRVSNHYSPKEEHRIYVRKAIKRIKENPPAAAFRATKAVFWAWVDVPGAMKTLDSKPAVKWILRIWNVGLILAALVGACSAIKFKEGRSALLILLYFTCFLAFLHPIPRYIMPVRPLVAFLAVFAGFRIPKVRA